MEHRLAHDLERLSDNLVPTDPATGEWLTKTQDKNSRLSPTLCNQFLNKDVTRLAKSIAENTAFRGELHLAYHQLTDLSGLALAKMLESNGQITALDLTGNRLTSKTAVFIAEALQTAQTSSLKKLSLAGNLIGAVGVRQACGYFRRLLEATTQQKQLEVLVLGILEDEAVNELAEHLPTNEVIVTLGIQEPEDTPWRPESKEKLVKAMNKNQSVREVQIETEDAELSASLGFFAERNQKKYESEEAQKERMLKLSADSLFDEFMQETGSGMSELPVRQHLKNSFGPLLKDALFEMRKRQARQRHKEYETITGGICFVADYLLQRLPQNEKYGLQNEQVEEEELS